jgi:hypothetical protein
VRGALVAIASVLLAAPSGAAAATTPAALTDPVDQWLPSSTGAVWTYQWSDSAYSPTSTNERYKLSSAHGSSFSVDWTTNNLGNATYAIPSAGTMDFSRSVGGLLAVNWSSTPAPPQFPILCASPSSCPNSLAGAFFMFVWGSRAPVLQEPLLAGSKWSSLGGANDDVSSENRYLGTQQIVVPAFPRGVPAAKVESAITQGGALGDPYGSGVRTVWWVRGVGPVKIDFRHTSGEVEGAQLLQTNLTPRPLPPDANYLPLKQGAHLTFRWRNSKHMKAWSTQRFTVSQVVNNTARVDEKSVSGPIRLVGSYEFSTRLTGVTEVAAATKAITKAKFPALGPRGHPRHFFTPFDLMAFGFNPVLPAYPAPGQAWSSVAGSSDFKTFGATGHSKILGMRRVKTKAGKFDALAVKTTLKQRGFRFGSGTRTSYFAAGKGLVKLVFRHRDGSVSTVERVK